MSSPPATRLTQLFSINKNMFNSAFIDVLKMFLEQHFDEENIGEFLELVITELKDVLMVWVISAGLGSDLAVQISKLSAALRLLKTAGSWRWLLRRDSTFYLRVSSSA